MQRFESTEIAKAVEKKIIGCSSCGASGRHPDRSLTCSLCGKEFLANDDIICAEKHFTFLTEHAHLDCFMTYVLGNLVGVQGKAFYVRNGETVLAQQSRTTSRILTSRGYTFVRSGDWVVENKDGIVFIIKNETLEKEYELI